MDGLGLGWCFSDVGICSSDMVVVIGVENQDNDDKDEEEDDDDVGCYAAFLTTLAIIPHIWRWMSWFCRRQPLHYLQGVVRLSFINHLASFLFDKMFFTPPVQYQNENMPNSQPGLLFNKILYRSDPLIGSWTFLFFALKRPPSNCLMPGGAEIP